MRPKEVGVGIIPITKIPPGSEACITLQGSQQCRVGLMGCVGDGREETSGSVDAAIEATGYLP